MPDDAKGFSDSALGFTKSPLGIIALFIVLVYGLASIALGVGFAQGAQEYLRPLVYFMTLFPVLVFFGFLWLVSRHHDKIYGPSDFKDESNFLKATQRQMSAAVSLAVAAAQYPGMLDDGKIDDEEMKGIVETVSVMTGKDGTQGRRKRVLWVDDRPENTIYERRAFEAVCVSCDLALSTEQALGMAKAGGYAAVISDMARKEGEQEGYVLLEALRKAGNGAPYFIYAGSGAQEHRDEAKRRGAQGSTNNPKELFKMVTEAVGGERS
jgi:CheY-like chemotaxis protein